MAGRLEIEHIDEQIENNMAVPDFGFDFLFEKADDEDVQSGWALLWDYICSLEKYERLENFISMRRDALQNNAKKEAVSKHMQALGLKKAEIATNLKKTLVRAVGPKVNPVQEELRAMRKTLDELSDHTRKCSKYLAVF